MEAEHPSAQASRLEISWTKFGDLVDCLAWRLRKHLDVVGAELITGPPRGGVLLASVLAYRLPLAYRPIELTTVDKYRTVVVDDVLDLGSTALVYGFDSFKVVGALYVKSWLPLRQWPQVLVAETNKWIVFPWEKEE